MELLATFGLEKNIGRNRVFADVSFSLGTGTIMGLFGPNGAGKTTLFGVLAGLRSFNKGTIRFGKKLTSGPGFFRTSGVRYLPDIPAYEPSMNGREHLRFFSAICKEPSSVALQFAEELGLGPDIDKPVHQYSLGMQRKLGLAMVLTGAPRLVFLDEPVNGLDIVSAETMYSLVLRQAKTGTSFIISSHRIAELGPICGQFIFLFSGKIVEQGAMSRYRPEKKEILTESPATTTRVLKGEKNVLDESLNSGRATFLERRYRQHLYDSVRNGAL